MRGLAGKRGSSFMTLRRLASNASEEDAPEELLRYMKVLMCGMAGAGKTSILQRWTEDEFDERYHASIGEHFVLHTVQGMGDDIVLQIWDTAGRSQARGTAKATYKNSDILILVVDVTSRISLSDANTYYRRFAKLNGPVFPVILIANKMDRRDPVLREDTLLRWMNSRPNRLKRLIHGSALTGVFDRNVIEDVVMMVKEFRKMTRSLSNMNLMAGIEDVEEEDDDDDDKKDDDQYKELTKAQAAERDKQDRRNALLVEEQRQERMIRQQDDDARAAEAARQRKQAEDAIQAQAIRSTPVDLYMLALQAVKEAERLILAVQMDRFSQGSMIPAFNIGPYVIGSLLDDGKDDGKLKAVNALDDDDGDPVVMTTSMATQTSPPSSSSHALEPPPPTDKPVSSTTPASTHQTPERHVTISAADDNNADFDFSPEPADDLEEFDDDRDSLYLDASKRTLDDFTRELIDGFPASLFAGSGGKCKPRFLWLDMSTMRCVISKKPRQPESSNEGFYVADLAETRAGPNSFYFLTLSTPPSVQRCFSIISSEATHDFEVKDQNDRDFLVNGFLKLSETFLSDGLKGQRNSVKASRGGVGSESQGLSATDAVMLENIKNLLRRGITVKRHDSSTSTDTRVLWLDEATGRLQLSKTRTSREDKGIDLEDVSEIRPGESSLQFMATVKSQEQADKCLAIIGSERVLAVEMESQESRDMLLAQLQVMVHAVNQAVCLSPGLASSRKVK